MILSQPPKPPPPGTIMVDSDGRLTKQGYDFFIALTRFLEALRKTIKE